MKVKRMSEKECERERERERERTESRREDEKMNFSTSSKAVLLLKSFYLSLSAFEPCGRWDRQPKKYIFDKKVVW